MGKEQNFKFLDEDENKKVPFEKNSIILVGLILIGLINLFLMLNNNTSESNIMILESSGSDKRALEKAICESAISSYRTNECAWGVMDEDTCYEIENSDDLVNTAARFKVLSTKMIQNKCKVFAKDQKEDSGKILRAFLVGLDKNEGKHPWIYQVNQIQEVFITEREKKEFSI
jgi:hypothetical protein